MWVSPTGTAPTLPREEVTTRNKPDIPDELQSSRQPVWRPTLVVVVQRHRAGASGTSARSSLEAAVAALLLANALLTDAALLAANALLANALLADALLAANAALLSAVAALLAANAALLAGQATLLAGQATLLACSMQ